MDMQPSPSQASQKGCARLQWPQMAEMSSATSSRALSAADSHQNSNVIRLSSGVDHVKCLQASRNDCDVQQETEQKENRAGALRCDRALKVPPIENIEPNRCIAASLSMVSFLQPHKRNPGLFGHNLCA
eukprot:296394-Pelagomonas_calceolata.AAC.2